MSPVPRKPSKIRIEHHSSAEWIKSITATDCKMKTAKAMRTVQRLHKQIRRQEIQNILSSFRNLDQPWKGRTFNRHTTFKRIASSQIIL